ncbi:von Willebrand factor type A [Pyrolobus fumarii 1A]|uniref:von Willebrand factor type A n=1 Tax=Pyrolobus fumarii (strain DSM 11204 / 1A) TaxID=694429 RepID=G0EHL3_PYRF1|nr:VWA domain-containing protein [Pyrolobus fumarii]AEM39366.1 von Willebrand factor type A [Pyrolobus fumarii 1A]
MHQFDEKVETKEATRGGEGLIVGVNYDDPAVQYRGERVLSLVRKLVDNDKLPDFVDDVFAVSTYYMFFLPVPMINREYASRVKDAKRAIQLKILSRIMSMDKFEEIRRYTIADSSTSMVVSAVFMETLVRESSNMSQQMPSSLEQKSGEGRESDMVGNDYDSNLHRAISRALQTAWSHAETAKQIQMLAARFVAGTGSSLTLEDSITDVLRLARNTDVRNILEMLKSIEEGETRFRRKVRKSPRGELDGYELGSDVERIVPSELALPPEFLAYKLSEGSLLLYRKVLPESHGPLYVLLDKSGSMMGTKILWAKAVALALAQRAARERRDYYVRFFDSIPYPPLKLPKNARGRDLVKLLDYIARIRANGGTDITRAVLAAIEDILAGKRSGVADIVLITDGEDKVTIEAVRRGLAKAKARLHTVMIQGNNPDLKVLSESYMSVVKLSKEEALKVVNIG